MYKNKAINYEIVDVNTGVVSKGRAEGYICPWEPLLAAKISGFANFNEVIAVAHEEESPSTFSLFNIV